MNLKDKIKNKGHVFGTWAMMAGSTNADAISKSGLDFIVLDLEHGTLSYSDCENMVRAIDQNGCSSIIRIGEFSNNKVLHALDLGAKSILVPNVSDATMTRKIINSAYYYPLGNRGLSPYTTCHSFNHSNLKDSLKKNNEEIFVGILIESIEGINNLDEILEVEGLDLIYLGLYDISISMGYEGDLNNKEMNELINKFIQKIDNSKRKIYKGIFVNSIERAKYFRDLNFEFIAYIADCYAIREFYSEKINLFNNK